MKKATQGQRDEFLASRLTKTFVVEGDYDDPENRVIPKQGAGVYFVDPTLKPEYFPIRSKGKFKKTMGYIEFDHEPHTDNILAAIKHYGVRNPDYAETRAFHKANPDERMEAPIISLCGQFGGWLDHYISVRFGFCSLGLRLYFRLLQYGWSRRVRVLVVCEEPL